MILNQKKKKPLLYFNAQLESIISLIHVCVHCSKFYICLLVNQPHFNPLLFLVVSLALYPVLTPLLYLLLLLLLSIEVDKVYLIFLF